jgi:hypothetical protein
MSRAGRDASLCLVERLRRPRNSAICYGFCYDFLILASHLNRKLFPVSYLTYN